MSRLTHLSWPLPIIQAPMAGVQDARLALAVIEAGGLGSLPAATFSLSQLAEQMQALADGAAGRPWAVNFFCHVPPQHDAQREAAWRQALAGHYQRWHVAPPEGPAQAARQPFDAQALALVQAHRPAVVSFHFGLPAPDLLAGVRATGALVLSSATTVDEACYLAEQGVDAVIAQGLEAGGHRGHFLEPDLSLQMGLMALLPQVVAAVRVPVVAAGGLADPRGVAAALSLGAVAAQVGTAYLRCPEAQTSALHRQALASPRASHTALTPLFTGRPARGIVNGLMRDLADLAPACVPAFPLATGDLAGLRRAAEAQGCDDFTPLWAGQHAAACLDWPATRLTRWLAGKPDPDLEHSA